MVFSRCLLALVLGLLSWPVTIWLIDFYDFHSPMLEEDSITWVISASFLSVVFFYGISGACFAGQTQPCRNGQGSGKWKPAVA